MKMKLLLISIVTMLFITGCNIVSTPTTLEEDENVTYEFHMTNAFDSRFDLHLEN